MLVGSPSGAIETLQPPIPQLRVSATSLPSIAVGAVWQANFEAEGGKAPYQWSINGGAIPRGFVLQPSGRLSGTASVPDRAAFTVTVTDSRGEVATKKFVLDPPPRIGDINKDGPVDCVDKTILMSQWDQTGPALTGDLNNDDTVALTDLSIMLSHWTGKSKEC